MTIADKPSPRRLLQVYRENYNPTLASLFHACGCGVEDRAEGVHIFDEDGRRYLDFSAGFGVFGLGHLDSRVQAAAQAQLAMLATTPDSFCTAPAAELMQSIAGLLPEDLCGVMLAGSGSEAIELALRTAILARPERSQLVAVTAGYHGKTLGALLVTGQEHLRTPFQPQPVDTRFVPFGDISAMASAIDGGALAVVIEPILGGGYITLPPEGYLSDVAKLCHDTGTLLIVDEVQTGFGRTGKMFAIEHEKIVPDMLILSKGATGGHVPMAATIISERVIAEAAYNSPSHLLDTEQEMACSPFACAAAKAAIDAIVEWDLAANADKVGQYLLTRLHDVVQHYPNLVAEAVGRGLMVGVKLRSPLVENAVWLQMLKRGVLTGISTNPVAKRPALRIFPPLTVGSGDIDVVVDALNESLSELNRRPVLLYDLANQVARIQYYLPKSILRLGAQVISPRPRAPERS
jgi:putrescine aminotransferase